MNLSTKVLKAAVKEIDKAAAHDFSIIFETHAGILRAFIKFQNLSGDTVTLSLAEEGSGGFDLITKTERLPL